MAGDEFHIIVLGLDESLTEEDTKKAYCYLARQFHPDKNQHLNCTDLMQIINEAKE